MVARVVRFAPAIGVYQPDRVGQELSQRFAAVIWVLLRAGARRYAAAMP